MASQSTQTLARVISLTVPGIVISASTLLITHMLGGWVGLGIGTMILLGGVRIGYEVPKTIRVIQGILVVGLLIILTKARDRVATFVT